MTEGEAKNTLNIWFLKLYNFDLWTMFQIPEVGFIWKKIF